LSLVLDSNILVKLVTGEAGSDEARKTVAASLRDGCTLYTVDAALAEALNALWKHVKIHRDLEVEEVKLAASDLLKIWVRLGVIPTIELYEETLDIAATMNMPVYDSLYVAAALKIEARLYTADRRLYEVSRKKVESELLA
jgi:predicted nucleic acid-binding protein